MDAIPPALRFGPDGLLLLYGLFVGVVLTSFRASRWPPRRAGLMAIAVSVVLAFVQRAAVPATSLPRQVLDGAFLVVPTGLVALISGAAAVTRRLWLLLIVSPVTFLVVYLGLRLLA